MKKKVIVGMSGGVDSTVAALLLKQQGYSVEGVFMKTWDGKYHAECRNKSSCYGPEEKEIEELEKISKILGINIHFVDAREEFKKRVIDYFKKEYLSGRTPNPCVVCNRFVKFSFIIQELEKKGIAFDFFATGHYANVEFDKGSGRFILKKANDRNKDQSYFLFLLTQEQLSRVIFPLGNFTKEQVKEIARKQGLKIVEKKESQDFIAGNRIFLFDKAEKGPIVDEKGNVLGTHKGIIHYTIGQRKGLGIASRNPLYVIKILAEENTIIVGEEKSLYRDKLVAGEVNFVGVENLREPMKVKTKIRYKHREAVSKIYPEKGNEILVHFDKPQRAITPGQAAVFYKDDILIGGGFIKD
ncbi:MAG: tRNA 2-thiouridine(34) synthase MnmA [bacterium]|nr:tRNA 2-thiouridine(34) synthase MnmA [bacterium]